MERARLPGESLVASWSAFANAPCRRSSATLRLCSCVLHANASESRLKCIAVCFSYWKKPTREVRGIMRLMMESDAGR